MHNDLINQCCTNIVDIATNLLKVVKAHYVYVKTTESHIVVSMLAIIVNIVVYVFATVIKIAKCVVVLTILLIVKILIKFSNP